MHHLENSPICKSQYFETAGKYYKISLQKDLFGNLLLQKDWGSKTNKRGGSKSFVITIDEVESWFNKIHKRRITRGYQLKF